MADSNLLTGWKRIKVKFIAIVYRVPWMVAVNSLPAAHRTPLD